MISITMDDITYINGEYILEEAKIYSKGSRTTRNLIKNKKIDSSMFIYVKLKDNEWIKTEGKSAKFDKVFFKRDFVIKIPEINDKNEDIIKDDKGVEKAPEIIELEEEQKFKDENNKSIEIETRGERNCDKVFFKVKDVSDGFGLENLNITILDKKSYFKEEEHYKFFICEILRKNLKKTSKEKTKKELFLTYEGVLRVLFSSHSSKVRKFIKWATESLFTIQIGTENQKEKLVSSLIGVNPKTIKDVFKTNTSKTPCVYLYLIGNANKLLGENYSENDLLCKYGCTEDLPRRCQEHTKKFSKEFNCDIEMICFSIIEAKYIFDAESNIKQYFKSNLIEYKNMSELITINKSDIGQIKQHYSLIQNSYIGRYEEMNEKIKQFEKEIIELNNKLKLKEKDNEITIMKYEHELKNKELELKNKDIELLNYKVKLLEKNNNQ